MPDETNISGEMQEEELPPAYFLNLTLENVRCFGPEQTLDLSDGDGNPEQWTMLLGDNGTGKTTILKSLLYLVPVPLASDNKYPLVPYGLSEKVMIDGKIKRGRGVVSQSSLRSDVALVSGETSYCSFQFTGDSDRGSARGRVGYHDTSNVLPYYEMQLMGYGASRKMEKGGFEQADETGFRGLVDSGFDLPNAHDWILQTDYAAKSGKEGAKRRLSQIKEILAHPETGVLPDVDGIRFAEQEGDFAPPKVEFHTPYGWVTMDQLSLGYRTMIAWVVDLARRLFERYPDMENPLEGPAVCLVDEIDLHLHPRWQRKIIGFLSERFPNTQFIVTAHSPLVVQAAQDANVALLKRSDEPDETGEYYVEIHNDMQPMANLRVDQILTSELYGLESARPPQMDALYQRREELLDKSELSPEEEEELSEIRKQIKNLAQGEDPEMMEAMDIIRAAAQHVDSEDPS